MKNQQQPTKRTSTLHQIATRLLRKQPMMMLLQRKPVVRTISIIILCVYYCSVRGILICSYLISDCCILSLPTTGKYIGERCAHLWNMKDGTQEVFYGTVQKKLRNSYKVVFDDGDVHRYTEQAVVDAKKYSVTPSPSPPPPQRRCRRRRSRALGSVSEQRMIALEQKAGRRLRPHPHPRSDYKFQSVLVFEEVPAMADISEYVPGKKGGGPLQDCIMEQHACTLCT